MRELLKAFKVLSEEMRLRMLLLLLEKDICVCELKEVFPLSTSQLSRNLNMLLEAGFLKRWREGRCVVYTADHQSPNRQCQLLLNMLAELLSTSEIALKDKERLEQVPAQELRQRVK